MAASVSAEAAEWTRTMVEGTSVVEQALADFVPWLESGSTVVHFTYPT